MTSPHKVFVPLFVVLMATAGPAFAGQHIVAPRELSEIVSARVAADDADRAAVREALARPDVQAVAGRMGVDPNRLTAVVDTLSGVDLRQAGTTARRVNEQLVGGASNVVISTTTIIIILLVVILIIIIAK
jgi:hypothetical protein